MASIEGVLLRHYFESQGFLVRQCLPHGAQGVESLQVINPKNKSESGVGPILFSSELSKLSRALVWLPGWNALKITPLILKNTAELCKFIDKRLAERRNPAEFEESDDIKIIVVPTIPTEEPYRSETIALLKARGIASMLSLRSVLQDLIARMDPREPREGLQLLQILSNFDLLKTKTTQMELFYDEKKK